MFAKVFGQIFDSSIARDYNCRRMFMDLLVLADSDGVVDMTFDAISRRTNVPLDEVKKYIDELCQPDPESRSKVDEGKRLVPIDGARGWGWQIVNYRHYRQIRDEEARRSYFRDQKRKQRRAAKKKNVQDTSVDTGGRCQIVPSASASSSASALFEEEGFQREWDAFKLNRKAMKQPLTQRAEELLLERLAQRPKQAVAALQMAIESNWRGFKWEWFDNQHEKQRNGTHNQRPAESTRNLGTQNAGRGADYAGYSSKKSQS